MNGRLKQLGESKLFLVLTPLFILLAASFFTAGKAHAANVGLSGCTTWANNGTHISIGPYNPWSGTNPGDGWNQTGFAYAVYDFGIDGTFNSYPHAYDDPVDYIWSAGCGPGSELVQTQPGGPGSNRSVVLNFGRNTNLAPVAVRLGMPPEVNNGNWRAGVPCTAVGVQFDFAYKTDGGSGGTSCGGDSEAGFVDDAGRAVIQNYYSGADTTIWCTGILDRYNYPKGAQPYPTTSNPNWSPAYTRADTDCASGQSPFDLEMAPSLSGAGIMQLQYNGPRTTTNTCWYSCFDSNIDYSSLVGRNGSGQLNLFYLKEEAKSDWIGGISSETVLTFKYPVSNSPPQLQIVPSCGSESLSVWTYDPDLASGALVTVSMNIGTFTMVNGQWNTLNVSSLNPAVATFISGSMSDYDGNGNVSSVFGPAFASATYGPCDKFQPKLSITPSCSAENFLIKVTDTDNTSASSSVTYTYPGGTKTVSVTSNGTAYTQDMSSYDQLLSYTITASTKGVQNSGAPGNLPVSVTAPYGPCYAPACGTGNVNPAVIEPSQKFNYSVTLGFTPLNGAGAATPTTKIGGTLSVFLNGGQIGNFTPFTSPPLSASSNAGSGVTGPSTTGTYTLSWTFVDGAVTTPPPPCGGGPTGPTIKVAYKPIFQVVGGDISVGGGFEPNCTAPANPSAISWNQNNAPTYSGAGDQFAVYSIGPINGFSTSQGNNALTPYGLSFANSGGLPTTPPDQFGGGLNQTACASDFYAGHPAPTGGAGSWTSLISGSYTGTQTTNGGNIPNGQHVTVYVQGDVYINGNITLGNGPYASLKDIPSFQLVVEGGNIIIGPGVSEVDGTYIAEPDSLGNNGTIATCKYTTKTAIADPACVFGIPGGTGGPLLVKGSFIAKSIIFARSNNDNNGAVPAETIIFSPAEWLSGTGSSSVIPNKYDSITNLPPVL